MNALRRFTLTGLSTVAAALACLVVAAPTQGQVLIDRAYPLITNGGGGCPADPLPHNDSALQNQAPICANLLGFSASNAAAAPGPFRVSEEFELATASTVTGFNFYAYQTGSTTTSTFTGAFVTLFTGPPMSFCAIPVAGDFTTNIMTASTFTGVYRSSQVGANALGCTRPIMMITATLPAPLPLPAGNYWVAWGLTGTLASGPFVPDLTLATLPPVSGVGEQFTSGAWAKLYDTGGVACLPPVPAPGYPVALPFQVLGTVSPFNPCAADVTGDLAINIDDLLGIINGWGPCSPTSPCYADIDGNGFVDIDDLLAIIAAWASCIGEFTLQTCTGPTDSNQWCVYTVDAVGSGPMPVGQRICIKCPMAPANANNSQWGSCPPLVNCNFNRIPGNNTASTGVNATAANNNCGHCTQPQQGGFRYTRNGW